MRQFIEAFQYVAYRHFLHQNAVDPGMITDARRSPEEWDEFLEGFVGDREIINRVKAQNPR
jgi:hypothetical protein